MDELLTQAVDAWVNPTDWAALYGSLRGTQDPGAFATTFPATSPQTLRQPNCVVVAEYARWALSSSGKLASIYHLQQECHRALVVQDSSPLSALVHAITNTVLAALEYRANQVEPACEALAKAARCYDFAWTISMQYTAVQATAATKSLGEDLSILGPAQRLLDLANRRGAFGINGVTLPTWLTLRSLLSHVLDLQRPAVICSNDLKALTVRGDRWINASRVDAKGRDSIERDHRFECNVLPTLRVEGDSRKTDLQHSDMEDPRGTGQLRGNFSCQELAITN